MLGCNIPIRQQIHRRAKLLEDGVVVFWLHEAREEQKNNK